MPHDIARAVDVHANIVLLERAVSARLREDRHHAVPRRCIVERARKWRDRALWCRQRDQERRERTRERFALLVEISASGERVAGEWI